MYNTEAFTPARFTAEGTVEIRGEKIPYNTVCEDNVFYNNDGKPIATIFSYSYFRSDVEDPVSRPVLFGFNGGPGSSSMMVHVGFLGAKRIKYGDVDNPTTLPPYEVIDNPNCLLDVADVVLVDPVATGFGLLLDESCDKKFFGIEEDAEALLMFINQWMTRYNRWGSPKYLIGESYGCTRASTAAGIATGRGSERSFGVMFDGLVLIGNTVTVGKYFGREVPVEPSVLAFPTMAAVNWYHKHPSQKTVDEFVAEAKKFADTEYLMALYQGEALKGDERKAVIEKIMYYTGVSESYLEERDLKLDELSFRSEVIKEDGKCVSRYDARITRPLHEPWTDEIRLGKRDDAVNDKYDPYFNAAIRGTLFPSLGINFDRSFVPSYVMREKWNKETPELTTGDQLHNAMLRCPGMRTFFANGWYDLCTQIGIVYYTTTHAHLPMDRTYIKGYPSGHMIYIGEDNIKSLTDDIRTFISGEDPTK